MIKRFQLTIDHHEKYSLHCFGIHSLTLTVNGRLCTKKYRAFIDNFDGAIGFIWSHPATV